MLLALLVITLVSRSISPSLNAVSVLEIIFPMTFILSPIDVCVDAVPIRFVILPLAVKYIAVNMPKLAFSVSLIVYPFSLIPGAIGPDLYTVTVADCALPLTLVNSPILELVLFSVLQREALVYLIMFNILIRVLTMTPCSILFSLVLLVEMVVKSSSPI
jgi:hypothetical protein